MRWHALHELPDLDEGNHYLNLLTQAVKSNGNTSYDFSGIAEVLKLPTPAASARQASR